jgi:hypothetical protein
MAFGMGTFSALGGAVDDIFKGQTTAKSLRIKAQGDLAEADNYDLAAQLAGENADFARQSRIIKEFQTQRDIYQGLGTTESDVAAGGFSMSGSALDIMRMGASQGALTKAVVTQQGLITEAGYREQKTALTNMSAAARWAASQEQDLANDSERNSWITGGIKAVAGIASLFL